MGLELELALVVLVVLVEVESGGNRRAEGGLRRGYDLLKGRYLHPTRPTTCSLAPQPSTRGSVAEHDRGSHARRIGRAEFDRKKVASSFATPPFRHEPRCRRLTMRLKDARTRCSNASQASAAGSMPSAPEPSGTGGGTGTSTTQPLSRIF